MEAQRLIDCPILQGSIFSHLDYTTTFLACQAIFASLSAVNYYFTFPAATPAKNVYTSARCIFRDREQLLLTPRTTPPQPPVYHFFHEHTTFHPLQSETFFISIHGNILYISPRIGVSRCSKRIHGSPKSGVVWCIRLPRYH